MRKAILDVLNNYLNRSSSKKAGTVDEIAIFHTIPESFKSFLGDRSSEFKIYGSIGQGNIATIPWVSVLHKDVTETTQRGVYIVLLFTSDMTGCYLSLNQGVTEFIERFSGNDTICQELKKSAESFRKRIVNPLNGIVGQIELKANRTLGSYYNFGNIQAFYYSKENIPDDEQLKKDFLILLSSYYKIIRSGSLGQNEENFQLYVNECALKKIKRSSIRTIKPTKQFYSTEKFKRDLKVSAFAIQNAEFMCEIDPSHQTFISESTRKNYVEAHHLIPLSCQDDFDVNLDVPENVVSLCPRCHRFLHFGLFSEKKYLLIDLYKKRKSALKALNIDVDEDKLLSFYNKT